MVPHAGGHAIAHACMCGLGAGPVCPKGPAVLNFKKFGASQRSYRDTCTGMSPRGGGFAQGRAA